MFIETEPTPNPATMKFLPGRDVMAEGVAEYTDADLAQAGSPLAARIFAVDGIAGVYLGADFVSVSKQEGQDWYQIKPAILGAIMEHFLSGDPVLAEGALPLDAAATDDSDPTIRQIKELIETRVRPAVARDGGDIVFQGFDRGIVYLRMRGACSGCPSSALTLKSGIENLLRYYVPDVVEVRAIG